MGHEHQHRPQLQQAWTQTWSLAAAHIQMTPWPQVAAQVTQIIMVPMATQSSDINMATDLSFRHLCVFCWQNGPQTSTHTPLWQDYGEFISSYFVYTFSSSSFLVEQAVGNCLTALFFLFIHFLCALVGLFCVFKASIFFSLHCLIHY